MERITRDRMLTADEAAMSDAVRAQVEAEFAPSAPRGANPESFSSWGRNRGPLRFQRRPTFIQAEQYFPETYPRTPGVGRDVTGGDYVVTIHNQRVYLEPGDWVIPESDGYHYYPCKPDVFDATYIHLPD